MKISQALVARGLWLSSTALLYATAGFAQGAPAPMTGAKQENEAGIANIVVTARRSNEALQSTPVAVTALSGAALRTAQVLRVDDLQRTTPSLSISAGGSGPSTVVYISLRGEGQVAPNSTADPAVGTYVDGVYIARPIGGNLDLLDVGQAEVLRGPQGTLFGRNTTGGAINIVTNQPTGRLEGLTTVEIGNYGQRRLQGVLNLPIIDDQLAVRFVGNYDEHDGYGEFVRTGRPERDVRGNYFGRASLRWTPNELPFSVTLSGDYSHFRDSGDAETTEAVNTNLSLGGITLGQAFALVGFDPSPYLTTKANFYRNFGSDDTGVTDLDKPKDTALAKGVSATINSDIGSVHLKSITAYRATDVTAVLDLDGLPINLYSLSQQYKQHQFSEEVQLSKRFGPVDFIGGAYYFVERGLEVNDSLAFSFINPAAVVGRGTDGNTHNTSYAAFGQMNYHINDKLRATAGLRYTWDARGLVTHDLSNRDDPTSCTIIRDVPGGPCNQSRLAHFSYPAWTAGLDYQLSRTLFLYGKTSGASMSGGWNIRDTFEPAYKPENVRDVELGFKSDLVQRRLRANVAVFYAWQSDVQRVVNAFDPVYGPTQYAVNAGDARVHGVELELTALPWRGMELTATASSLRGNYVAGTFTETQTIDGLPYKVDRSGERLPQLPRWSFRFGATQTIPLSFGKAAVHLDYSYISSRAFYQATAAAEQPQSVKDQYAMADKYGIVPGFGLIDGRASLNLNRPNVELALWVKNMANKKYIRNTADLVLSLGVVQDTVGDPRTYGFSASYHW